MIYGYGVCRGNKSGLPNTFWRRIVIYRYGACQGKIGIFLRLIAIILKEIQLYLVQT